MSFLWTKDGRAVTSRCTLCGMTTRSLSESAIYGVQRSHDAMTCQRRRAEAAYANSPEGQAETRARAGYDFRDEQRADLKPERTHCANGHDWTPENLRTTTRGYEVCKVCDREYYQRKKIDVVSRVSRAKTRELGVALGTIETSGAAPDLTPKPLLNTPIERSIHMQNRSTSATPRQNSRGVA
jgi:hypothetical protein